MTVALAAAWGVGRAADPPQPGADPPDQGLLEFLGSADPTTDSTEPEDGSWLAYLAQVNLGKTAKTSPAPQAPAPPKSPNSAAGGDKPSG